MSFVLRRRRTNLKLSSRISIALIATGRLTNEEWLFILSILLTALQMLQTYLENNKE